MVDSMRVFLLFAALAAVGSVACKGDSPTPAAPPAPTAAAPTPVPPPTPVKTASGLEYLEVTPGTGTVAEPGRTVRVRFTLTNAGGVKIDEGTIEFEAAGAMTLPGIDEGVLGMKTGGTRRLTIPAALAYAGRSQAPAGANGDLTAEVALLEVLDASGVTKP